MPTRNVSLTPELDSAVAARVKSGKYESASDVVRAALRALDQREREDAAKLRWLRKAIAEGDASGVDPGYSLDAIFEEAGLTETPPVKRARRKR